MSWLKLRQILTTLNKGVQKHAVGQRAQELQTSVESISLAIFVNTHPQPYVLFLKGVCVRMCTHMFTHAHTRAHAHTHKKRSGRFHTNTFTVIIPGWWDFE